MVNSGKRDINIGATRIRSDHKADGEDTSGPEYGMGNGKTWGHRGES